MLEQFRHQDTCLREGDFLSYYGSVRQQKPSCTLGQRERVVKMISSATDLLCDREQVISPVCASVSSTIFCLSPVIRTRNLRGEVRKTLRFCCNHLSPEVGISSKTQAISGLMISS